MTLARYIATDTSKYAEVELAPILRRDRLGNTAGGFTLFESGPKYTICFEQAEGRRFVEALAEKFGGQAVWGLRQENAS